MNRSSSFSFIAIASAVATAIGWIITMDSYAQSENTKAPLDQPVAVEESMHDLMEYVFQPAYKRLRTGMATEPADRKAWRGVTADILTLAESNNLLLHRKPENDVTDWLQFSAAARSEGGKLYQAAKKAAYAEAKVHYAAMLIQCNACHKQFAEGKHQLEP